MCPLSIVSVVLCLHAHQFPCGFPWGSLARFSEFSVRQTSLFSSQKTSNSDAVMEIAGHFFRQLRTDDNAWCLDACIHYVTWCNDDKCSIQVNISDCTKRLIPRSPYILLPRTTVERSTVRWVYGVHLQSSWSSWNSKCGNVVPLRNLILTQLVNLRNSVHSGVHIPC